MTTSERDANAMFAVPRVIAPTSGVPQGSALLAAGAAPRYRTERATTEPDSARRVLTV